MFSPFFGSTPSIRPLLQCLLAWNHCPVFQPLPGRSEARCHLAMADRAMGCMGTCTDCCWVGVAWLKPWPVKFVLWFGLDERVCLVGSWCDIQDWKRWQWWLGPCCGTPTWPKKGQALMWSRTVFLGWCCYQSISLVFELVMYFTVSILISHMQHDQQDLRSRCERKLRLGFSSNFTAAALAALFSCTLDINILYIYI